MLFKTFRHHIKSFYNVLHWIKLNTILNWFRIKKESTQYFIFALWRLHSCCSVLSIFGWYTPDATWNTKQPIKHYCALIWKVIDTDHFFYACRAGIVNVTGTILKIINLTINTVKYMYKHRHSTETHPYSSSNSNQMVIVDLTSFSYPPYPNIILPWSDYRNFSPSNYHTSMYAYFKKRNTQKKIEQILEITCFSKRYMHA